MNYKKSRSAMLRYFVVSDKMEYGAYCSSLFYAKELQKSIISNGGDDAKIYYDSEKWGLSFVS